MKLKFKIDTRNGLVYLAGLAIIAVLAFKNKDKLSNMFGVEATDSTQPISALGTAVYSPAQALISSVHHGQQASYSNVGSSFTGIHVDRIGSKKKGNS